MNKQLQGFYDPPITALVRGFPGWREAKIVSEDWINFPKTPFLDSQGQFHAEIHFDGDVQTAKKGIKPLDTIPDFMFDMIFRVAGSSAVLRPVMFDPQSDTPLSFTTGKALMAPGKLQLALEWEFTDPCKSIEWYNVSQEGLSLYTGK